MKYEKQWKLSYEDNTCQKVWNHFVWIWIQARFF